LLGASTTRLVDKDSQGGTGTASERRPGSGSTGLRTCHSPCQVGGIGQGRGLKGIGCGLQGPTSNLEVVVGAGVVLFLPPLP